MAAACKAVCPLALLRCTSPLTSKRPLSKPTWFLPAATIIAVRPSGFSMLTSARPSRRHSRFCLHGPLFLCKELVLLLLLRPGASSSAGASRLLEELLAYIRAVHP